MTTPIEAMKMALVDAKKLHESLEPEDWCGDVPMLNLTNRIITALTQAIEQMAKAEPVAWLIYTDNQNLHKLDPNRECSWLAFDIEQFKYTAAKTLMITATSPLYLHPAPAVPEGWQPIETAPKTGRHLAVMRNGVISVILWLNADHPYADESGWYEQWNFDSVEPTHWMPLSAAPEAPK